MTTPAADKLSFKLSRRIGWRMASPLAFGLLLGAGMWDSLAVADSRFASSPQKPPAPRAEGK
jgi:hypothetical protein